MKKLILTLFAGTVVTFSLFSQSESELRNAFGNMCLNAVSSSNSSADPLLVEIYCTCIVDKMFAKFSVNEMRSMIVNDYANEEQANYMKYSYNSCLSYVEKNLKRIENGEEVDLNYD